MASKSSCSVAIQPVCMLQEVMFSWWFFPPIVFQVIFSFYKNEDESVLPASSSRSQGH